MLLIEIIDDKAFWLIWAFEEIEELKEKKNKREENWGKRKK